VQIAQHIDKNRKARKETKLEGKPSLTLMGGMLPFAC
jgi:hypothetical protein